MIEVPTDEELLAALEACREAGEGDSNDEEIDALRVALDLALRKLGIDFPIN